MKRISFLIAFGFMAISNMASSQTNISFLYDDSGNRTDRVIDMSKSARIPGTFGENREKELTDEIGELTVTIYPNPTTGKIKVVIVPFEKSSSGRILVYDANGKSVLRQEYLSPVNVVDISDVQNGIYFLKLIYGGQTFEWKIVKQ